MKWSKTADAAVRQEPSYLSEAQDDIAAYKRQIVAHEHIAADIAQIDNTIDTFVAQLANEQPGSAKAQRWLHEIHAAEQAKKSLEAQQIEIENRLEADFEKADQSVTDEVERDVIAKRQELLGQLTATARELRTVYQTIIYFVGPVFQREIAWLLGRDHVADHELGTARNLLAVQGDEPIDAKVEEERAALIKKIALRNELKSALEKLRNSKDDREKRDILKALESLEARKRNR